MMLVLFLKLLLTSPLLLNAQDIPHNLPTKKEAAESAPDNRLLVISDEKFAAVVQHTKGHPFVVNNQKKTTVDFKDVIHFDQNVFVPKGSRIKLITQKRCVAVLYDGTEVMAPADKGSPWEFKKGSARWICPEDKVERILYRGKEIQVQNGEFLLIENKLIPFKNNIIFEGHPLKLNTVYIYKDEKWETESDQPDEYELWQRDHNYAIPKESSRLEAKRPEDPHAVRIFLNGMVIGISGAYNHEWSSSASAYDMETHGIRLGTNFPWKNKSIIAFVDYEDASSPDEKRNDFGPPPVGLNGIRLEQFTLGVGLRHNHKNSSSFYYYLGLSNLKYKFHLRPETNYQYDGKIDYKWALALGGGFQKIFFMKSWISLMLGLDARITQTLSQGNISYYNQNYFGIPPIPPERDPRAALTNYSVVFYLGPVLNF